MTQTLVPQTKAEKFTAFPPLIAVLRERHRHGVGVEELSGFKGRNTDEMAALQSRTVLNSRWIWVIIRFQVVSYNKDRFALPPFAVLRDRHRQETRGGIINLKVNLSALEFKLRQNDQPEIQNLLHWVRRESVAPITISKRHMAHVAESDVPSGRRRPLAGRQIDWQPRWQPRGGNFFFLIKFSTSPLNSHSLATKGATQSNAIKAIMGVSKT